MPDLAACKVLMVLPQGRFTDTELKTMQAFLERRKITVKTAAPQKKETFGLQGTRVRPDHALPDVDASEFDAIIFVGGIGSRDLWDDAAAHRVAREAVDAGALVCAISNAPIILARAGLLNGREATVYFSETKLLAELGAKYTGATITVDENIITCKGSEAVEKLALGLIKRLSEK